MAGGLALARWVQRLAWCALLTAGAAQAHKSSDAYVHLRGGAGAPPSLRVDVALRDLDVALDLDTNGDGRLLWGEIRTAWPAIEAYLSARLQLDGCTLAAATRSLERRSDGVYAALLWQPDCGPDVLRATAPALRYAVLAEIDPTHRGLARIEWAVAAPSLRVLVPKAGAVRATAPQPAAPASAAASRLETVPQAAAEPVAEGDASPFEFVREGVRHILTGYDHVLFLVCLLLPAVMRRSPHGWQPVERLAQAVWPVAGIVTAFTVAHSITLGLAATGTFVLDSDLIEPAIALTIMLAAFDNLRSIFGVHRAAVTFGFGLIHGFGFAGVLAELNLPAGQFAWALLQFNLGLEAGQLLIVALVASALFCVRRSAHYVSWVLRGGSVVALVIAALWLVERTADVSILPV